MKLLTSFARLKDAAAIAVLLLVAQQPAVSQSPTKQPVERKLFDPSVDEKLGERIVMETYQVPDVAKPTLWDRFRIFVWQYKTEARRDAKLYEQVGLSAFHIDRGAGQSENVQWAIEQQRPYYVDHAAGKGILHLTQRSGLSNLRNDGTLQDRPYCLVQRDTISELTKQIDQNLEVSAKGPALAIALDDEISLGTFNSPLEVDTSAPSVNVYRRWLQQKYGSITQLNDQWETTFQSFDEVHPVSFEEVRLRINKQPFSKWNLSPWVDWRSYMDTQFSATIGHLVGHAGTKAAEIPVGFVGGQQPSPFGGFDYEKLNQAVQWIESYDIGGTNELLVSLWHESRKPIVQTFFATGDAWRDQWFLWYYWAHGNAGVIAWPDRSGNAWFQDDKVQPEIERLASTFQKVQAPELGFTSANNVHRVHDQVAILYSHPSVQVSWATDALTHGKTWPRRSSSLDNDSSSAGKNRVAWNKLLEDCGYQARWISVDQLESDVLVEQGFKILVLPRAMALSDESCDAIRRFHRQGGTVVADYWTGLFDQHGKARMEAGRLKGGLDDLFDNSRNESAGYFDGQTFSEVDGERYNRPFLERLPAYSTSDQGLNVVELGTTAGRTERATYLNLSPVAYYDRSYRLSEAGQVWRKMLGRLFANCGIKPYVLPYVDGEPVAMVETIRWRQIDHLRSDITRSTEPPAAEPPAAESPERAEREWLIVIPNPTRDAAIDGAGEMQILDQTQKLELRFSSPHGGLVNFTTGRVYEAGEPVIVEIAWPQATVLEYLPTKVR